MHMHIVVKFFCLFLCECSDVYSTVQLSILTIFCYFVFSAGSHVGGGRWLYTVVYSVHVYSICTVL